MLISVADLKDHVGIASSVTSKDALLGKIAAGVSKFVDTYCNRIFEEAEYTEYQSGGFNGTKTLFLKQFPVIQIMSITIDDVAVDIETEESSGSLIVEALSGEITRKSGFAAGHKNIKIVYSAGYLPNDESGNSPYAVPEDLYLTVIRLAARVYERRTAEGVMSVSPSSFTASFRRELDDDIIDVLQAYKKYA